MSDYDFMQDTVDALCEDMENNPDNYRITTFTLDSLGDGVEYWTATGAITQIWNGHTTEDVFSYKQGVQIYKAFLKLQSVKSSVAQKKVIASLVKKEVTTPPPTTEYVGGLGVDHVGGVERKPLFKDRERLLGILKIAAVPVVVGVIVTVIKGGL